MKSLKVCYLWALLSLLTACGNEDHVDPLVEPKTLKEQVGATVKIKYVLSDIEVNRPISSTGRNFLTNNPISNLIRGIGNTFADIFIRLDGDVSVSQEKFRIHVPNFDPTFITKVKVDNVKLFIKEGRRRTDLEFVKSIKIKSIINRKEVAQDGSGRIIRRIIPVNVVEFNQKEHSLGCIEGNYKKNHCMEFDVSNVNLLELVNDEQEIVLSPDFSIKKSPRGKMLLDCEIDFEVTINSPF